VRNHLVRALAFAAALFVWSGCGKSEKSTTETRTEVSETSPAPASEVLPGASSVRAALEKKDYQTAVGALIALEQLVASQEQRGEYNAVYDEVRETLMQQSATDRKAADALGQLRVMRTGR
jgi:hypothetical protein